MYHAAVVEVLVNPGGGNLQTAGLGQYQPGFGHILQLGEDFAASCCQHRAAFNAEGDIAAQLSGQLFQLIIFQVKLPITVQTAQNCCRITAAACQSCCQKNFFVQGDVNVRNNIAVTCEQGSCSVGQVIRTAAEVVQIAADLNAVTLADNNLVAQTDALHNHTYLMVAVLSLTENIESQIYFGICRFFYLLHYKFTCLMLYTVLFYTAYACIARIFFERSGF